MNKKKINKRIPNTLIEDLMINIESLVPNILTVAYYHGILLVLLIIVFGVTDDESIFATITLACIIGIIAYASILLLYKLRFLELKLDKLGNSYVYGLFNPVSLFVQGVFCFLFGGLVQIGIYDDTLMSQSENVFTSFQGLIVGLVLAALIAYNLLFKSTPYTTKSYFKKIKEYQENGYSYQESITAVERLIYENQSFDTEVPQANDSDINNDDYQETYYEPIQNEQLTEEESIPQSTIPADEGKMVRKRRR